MKHYLTYLFMFLGFYILSAQENGNTPYPASAYPDRIFRNITEDPSTTVAISWRTDKDTRENYIEILPAVSDPALTKDAVRQMALTEPFQLKAINVNYHSARVRNLMPNTLYMYRVGNGDHWSEWFHITTAGKIGEKFSFIYLGDVQLGMRTLWPRVAREAFVKNPDAGLILYAGDIVNRGFNDHEWGELFYGGGFIHGTVPGFPTPGNHEHADNEEGVNVLTTLWRPQFALPENGPEGLEETVYYADVQGVRFISLNSQAIWFGGEMMQRQIDWLHRVLKDNPNKWTCITFHHPVYSVSAQRDNKNLRENFQPIFEQYKVDLVLQGHDHAYGRGMKKIPMPFKKGATSATMYVVSMCGSKMYDDKRQDWMDKEGGNIQLYQIVTVQGNRLSYKAYGAAGELFDAFELVKAKGRNNRLIEKK